MYRSLENSKEEHRVDEDDERHRTYAMDLNDSFGASANKRLRNRLSH
jgi:hypothetical protein